MRLSEGIGIYVQRKRADGFAFESGSKTLSRFRKQIGDLQLSEVTTQHVSNFLNRSQTANKTWRINHSLLRRFFEYFASRNAMPMVLMPQNRPPIRSTSFAHVYTREELRALIRTIPRCQKHGLCGLDRQTLRSAVLLLYGTGAKVDEVSRLRVPDVDIKKGYLTIANNRFGRSRKIPICRDLRTILKSHLAFRLKKRVQHDHFFLARDGRPLTADLLRKSFQRLRRYAGVLGAGDLACQPQLHDLRSTFAVHRIASWIRKKADLNRMLPALAAYMGLAGLTATERYLSLTPERFRKELMKLSPQKAKKHWRDDPILMKFLSSL